MKTLFLVIINILITSALLEAQTIGTPDWAKRGGAWAIAQYANGSADMVREILIDKHGNVYVSAQNPGKVNIDGHIAAPDSNAIQSVSSWDCNGNFRWMKVGVNTATIGLLGLDTLENIYIITSYHNQSATDTGIIYPDTSFTGIGNAHYIVKYNSNGNLQWMKPSAFLSTSKASVLANGTFYLYSYSLLSDKTLKEVFSIKETLPNCGC